MSPAHARAWIETVRWLQQRLADLSPAHARAWIETRGGRGCLSDQDVALEVLAFETVSPAHAGIDRP